MFTGEEKISHLGGENFFFFVLWLMLLFKFLLMNWEIVDSKLLLLFRSLQHSVIQSMPKK